MRALPFSALLWRLNKSFSTNTLFLSLALAGDTMPLREEILLLTRGRLMQSDPCSRRLCHL